MADEAVQETLLAMLQIAPEEEEADG